MGKPKIWNISKTADRRAKLTKIWVLGYYCAHSEGACTFDARFLEFGVIQCILQNFQFYMFELLVLLLFSQFLSDFVQTLYKVS